ncbi:MAG: fibronectin type III-like domain-contianing protein, partial [Olleya sp.]
KNTGRPVLPGEDVVFWSHFQDEKNDPLYVFGHGLSYTTFDYSNLKVDNSFSDNNRVKVSVDLTNSGKVKGKEVVQLYIRDLYASITRPVKELKGFELVELEPGETKTIQLTLTKEELGFFNNQGEFIVEEGDFEVYVGGSSKTTLQDKFTL